MLVTLIYTNKNTIFVCFCIGYGKKYQGKSTACRSLAVWIMISQGRYKCIWGSDFSFLFFSTRRYINFYKWNSGKWCAILICWNVKSITRFGNKERRRRGFPFSCFFAAYLAHLSLHCQKPFWEAFLDCISSLSSRFLSFTFILKTEYFQWHLPFLGNTSEVGRIDV